MFFSFFFPRGDYIEPVIVENQENAHLIANQTSSALSQMNGNIPGQLALSHAHFSPKSPDRNFEIAFFFRSVEKRHS